MLTIEQCRKIEPSLNNLSEEEVLEIRDDLYEMAQLAFENWQQSKRVPKIPSGYCEKNP